MDYNYVEMFKKCVNINNEQNAKIQKQTEIKNTKQIVEQMCTLLNVTTSDNNSTKKEIIVDSKQFFNVNHQKQPVEDFKNKEFYDKIKSLHCLFTWDFKSFKKQDILPYFQNKYGCNNIDISKCISTSGFTFVR